MPKYIYSNKVIIIGLVFAFFTNSLGLQPVYAQKVNLPALGTLVNLIHRFHPTILKGLKVNPENPFRFDFIVDKGDSLPLVGRAREGGQQEQLKTESTKLIKYFMASLTTPENDLWVNLSPYEKNHIIPQAFGQTEMGRDLLAQDYLLKQITSSLMYPEDETGKKFWKRIYEEAQKKLGTTQIPVDTFNKVWIVPEKAVVYENAKAGTAYVVESKLKVMLEQDYLATSISPPLVGGARGGVTSTNTPLPNPPHQEEGSDSLPATLAQSIIREVIIPELTKEINEGQNFAPLRQVYNSLILATWYKKKIKDSILNKVYADKNKIKGTEYTNNITLQPTRGHDFSRVPMVLMPDTRRSSPDAKQEEVDVESTPGKSPNDVELIYNRYVQAFKKGVYNYIKEEQDPITQQIIPKKYFSGGIKATDLALLAFKTVPTIDEAQLSNETDLLMVRADMAMLQIENDRIILQNGSEIKTSLSDEQLKIIMQNPKSYYVANNNGSSALRRVRHQWIEDKISLNYLDFILNIIEKIRQIHALKPNEVINLLDWGTGNGQAMIELSKLLTSEGIKHHIYALSSDYYANWQNASKDITFILDDATNLNRYLAPESIDLGFSNLGIHHIVEHSSFRFFEGDVGKHIDDLIKIIKTGGVFRIGYHYSENTSASFPKKPSRIRQLANSLMGQRKEDDVQQERKITYAAMEFIVPDQKHYAEFTKPAQQKDNAQLNQPAKLNIADAAMVARMEIDPRDINEILSDNNLRLSSADKDLIKKLQSLVIDGKDGKQYRFYYHSKARLERVRFGLNPIDVFLIREIGQERNLGGKEEYLVISPLDSKEYFNSYGLLAITFNNLQLSKEHRQQGIFTAIVKDFPPGTKIALRDIQEPSAYLTIIDSILEMRAIDQVFNQGEIEKLRKIKIKIINEEKDGVKDDLFELLLKYQHKTQDLNLHSLSGIFYWTSLGKAMLRAGFRNPRLEITPEMSFLGASVELLMNVYYKKDMALVANTGASDQALVVSDTDDQDKAMNAKTGGIDLTSDKALTIQNNGEAIKFNIDPAMLEQLQNAPGFVPVIISIQPMTDIRMFLGLDTV